MLCLYIFFSSNLDLNDGWENRGGERGGCGILRQPLIDTPKRLPNQEPEPRSKAASY